MDMGTYDQDPKDSSIAFEMRTYQHLRPQSMLIKYGLTRSELVEYGQIRLSVVKHVVALDTQSLDIIARPTLFCNTVHSNRSVNRKCK